ncbi:MAG: cytidylate kinase [Cyclobacteriaceae bacterium]|jgi:cytidylate kinase
MMKKIIVAIDGYSGTGKSSTAREVAKALDYIYVDSGAMYRAVAFYMLQNSIDVNDHEKVVSALPKIELNFKSSQLGAANEIYLNGIKIEKEIREPAVSAVVSKVASLSAVRKLLVEQQQAIGKEKGVVMDGRDISTVVFPTAELKIFMTANVKIRAERRAEELKNAGVIIELSEIENNLTERDMLDSTRKDSPLLKDDESIEIDTSYMSFEDQVLKIVDLAHQARGL